MGTARDVGGGDFETTTTIPGPMIRSRHVETWAKERNVEVLLCGMLAPPSMGAEYQREYTRAFPDLAAEHKVDFLPFLLENVALNRELNQADGIHPNARGTQIMANNIYAALKPLLNETSR